MSINYKLDDVLFSAAEIKQKVEKELSVEVSLLVKCIEDPLFICTMDGAIHFFSDLTRNLYVPVEYGFIRAKSYKGTESTCSVNVELQSQLSVTNRHVFLVEDIVDTGRTIGTIQDKMLQLGAIDVRIISLLDKPSRRFHMYETLKIDVIGWNIPDKFVVGYGLDLDGKYRNLPYIGVLKEED